jgi:hypothetical protein
MCKQISSYTGRGQSFGPCVVVFDFIKVQLKGLSLKSPHLFPYNLVHRAGENEIIYIPNLRALLAYLNWCLVRGSCTHTYNNVCVPVCGCGVSNYIWSFYILYKKTIYSSLLGLNIVAELCITEASGGKVLPDVLGK